MFERNTGSPAGSFSRPVQRVIGALALAACVLCPPVGQAGQASARFNVSVTLLPPSPTCTASIDANGAPQVDCRPPAVIVGAGKGDHQTGSPEAVLGYRLPDSRVKLGGAVVDVGEESFLAWSEYSSRLIVAGGVEYVEMTVTW